MPLWMRVDKAISRHMIWLVLSGLAIGILFPDTFSPVRAWAGPLMATITFCNSLSGSFRKIGHVLLHPTTNTYFLRSKTRFSVGSFEYEANLFAVCFLISDEDIEQNREYSLCQLSSLFGIPEELVRLRIEAR